MLPFLADVKGEALGVELLGELDQSREPLFDFDEIIVAAVAHDPSDDRRMVPVALDHAAELAFCA